MISYVDDWTKGSKANTICIYTFIKFMCTFYTLHVSLSLVTDSDCTELRALLMLMFVRQVDFLCASFNQYPQHFWAGLHNFLFTRWAVLLEPLLLTCSAFVYCLKKENITETYKCWFWFYPTYSLSQYTGEFTIHSNVLYAYNAFFLSRIPLKRFTFCIVEISISYISITC